MSRNSTLANTRCMRAFLKKLYAYWLKNILFKRTLSYFLKELAVYA